MTKLQLLLLKGFFPSQLPPCFSAADFSKKSGAIKKKLNTSQPKGFNGHAQLEVFSVARATHSRRTISLVNPIPQFYLANHIATGWKKIIKHYENSPLSVSKPVLVESENRAILITPLKQLNEIKVIRSAGHRYVLISDVAQFFPTLYTHAIPWALDGKSKVKSKLQSRKKKANKSFGDQLDHLLTRCQDWQTSGIPIGPDTSHVVAEIIGTAIDVDLVEELEGAPSGFRYVDDFYFFFDTYAEAGLAEAALQKILRRYELKQNIQKTKIISIERLLEDSWTFALQNFKFADGKKQQRRDISHFFDIAFKYASENVDENVMKFSLKKIQTVIIKKENWELVEAYLCRVALSYPNTLQEIAHILSTYHFHKFELNLVRLSSTMSKLIQEHAQLEHHSEVVWALWICSELKIKLPLEITALLTDFQSSPSLILALDMEKRGLLTKSFDKRKLLKHASKKALYGHMWLLSYESGVNKWISKNDSYLTTDSFFSVLRGESVSFYHPNRKLEPIFKRRPGLGVGKDPFDMDTDVTDDFEFIDIDDDYNDKPTYWGDEDEDAEYAHDSDDDIPL